MNQPLVSILITAYNREQYISAAIESVLAQEYQCFELIITDDKSTDQTLALARSYEHKDKRIKVYENEINLGDYENRNRAASYAKGKYLKYLDADDLIYPYSLKIMVEAMERFPDAGLGMEEPFYDELYEPFPILREPALIYKNHFLNKGVLLVGPSATIIRSSIFFEQGGFSSTRYIGDTDLWLRIATHHPVVFFQPALVFWRQHEGQEIVSELKNTDNILLRYFLNLKYIKGENSPLNANDKRMAIHKCNRRLIVTCFRIAFFQFKPAQSFSILTKSDMTIRDITSAIFH